MREDRRRVENVRLVRLPNGQLVTQEQAEIHLKSTDQKGSDGNGQAKATSDQTTVPQKSKFKTRRERKEAAKRKQKVVKRDEDILEVWHKQQEIKKESERLELEYELAKKMTKDIKRQMKVREVSYDENNIDEAFKDLLSPETKKFAKKVSPHLRKAKEASKDRLSLLKIQSRKWQHFSKILYKKIRSSRKLTAVSILGVVVLFTGVGVLFKQITKPRVSVSQVQGTNTKDDGRIEGLPEYKILTPANKSTDELTTVTRRTPSGTVIFSYKDIVSGVPIEISQQELPDNFRANPGELESFAKDQYFTQKTIQIDETQVFAGVNENGTQTAVFAKEDLLVFVKADMELSEVQWVQYVTNLVKK